MKVKFHAKFIKNYRKRILSNKKLDNQVKIKIEQFKINPNNPILKDHNLTGTKKGLKAFSLTGDIRIIYRPSSDNEVVFMDIGSHNQVY